MASAQQVLRSIVSVFLFLDWYSNAEPSKVNIQRLKDYSKLLLIGSLLPSLENQNWISYSYQ